MLLEAGVSRVFVGARDPNPIVNGKGVRCLRQAGVAVRVGLLGKECRRLNEAYEHRVRTGRVFVVGKLAQSVDGRVATRSGESQWITGAVARRTGHRLRNELDGILVGVGTVLADDARLTCRIRGGRDPARVVLDTHARTPPRASVVTATRDSAAPTWIFVGHEAPARRRRALERAGAETVVCPLRQGRLDLGACLELLAERGLLSVLVEGGPTVMGSLFDASLVCKVVAFVAPMVIGGGNAIASVGGRGVARLTDAPRLREVQVARTGHDLMITGYPDYPARA
jgi:diaminohydroxyphosphoribosylaminopyrimidine deaminase/5-amino-6-(5-phosphoribosylamino)uracil reductase